jgi:hypothetical protein
MLSANRGGSRLPTHGSTGRGGGGNVH